MIHFLNLTNGLEAIDDVPTDDAVAFVRIQSTACEQKRWAAVLDELDSSFLMSVALGRGVIVHDRGARKATSRAIYQGVPWIRYALSRRWLDIVMRPTVRGHDVSSYFDSCYRSLPKTTKARLDRFGRFADGVVDIATACKSTTHDGDDAFYRACAERALPRVGCISWRGVA